MISPIGSFLTYFDGQMQTAMTAGITGLIAYVATPVATALGLFYLIQGIKIAQGDGGPVSIFVTNLVKNVIILKFCSNAALYNQWVTGLFFVGLPTALSKAVLQNVGPASVANGVQGTAAAFDQISAQLNQMVNNVQAHAGMLDVSSRLAAVLCGFTGGLGLIIIAMVYLLARILLAVVIELGVLAVACLIFDATKPIFERWLGKVIALVFLQVTAIVVMQIILSMDQQFMQQIGNAAPGSAGVPSELQALVSMVLLFFMGAFAVYSLPAIAYSIGTGVSVSMLPMAYMAGKALRAAAGGLPGLGSAIASAAAGSGGAANAGSGLSLGFAEAELTGSATANIRAPDPASLSPPPLSLPGF